ncbi:calcium/calmodulin-dependent protein kinase type 1D-like [Arachis ipaensis]|uniref:calcium/calmodulin-dependent protein kinase type 1D-like n=1 Tax=Arachis ipaensis TaxID=130454 RepID=UPI000A2B63A1|nr:calcium/calmodulin-dependent protein kinase type 1D-like [Arachis ipaensis]
MIVKGLSHIHRKGIVYCDLMPENILLFPSLDKESANYQLKIADFGLSKTKEEKVDVEVWKSKPRGTPSLPAWVFSVIDFLEKCFMKDPSKRWTAEMLLDHPFLYITLFPSYYLATWL